MAGEYTARHDVSQPMKSLHLLVAIPFLALLPGCATEMNQRPDGLYVASRAGFATNENPLDILAKVREDAQLLCAKSGQVVQTVNSETRNGIPSQSPPFARLDFRCVAP
jgi:hypothetical protein